MIFSKLFADLNAVMSWMGYLKWLRCPVGGTLPKISVYSLIDTLSSRKTKETYIVRMGLPLRIETVWKFML